MNPELKKNIEELGVSFEEFKEHYNERLKEEEERTDEIQKKMNRPAYSDPNSQPENGGKSLNDSGSVKMYTPEQKLIADAQKSEHDDVSLGSFLRAVVDKAKNANERELLQKSVDSSGYSLPTQIASELIDRLRAANPLLMAGGAGARTLSIEGGETKFIKINSDPNAVWHAELTEESLSDPGFGSVAMDPKTVLSMTEVSRELLQDSVNIEQALVSAFVGSINDAILDATFTGSGANTPTGLASTVTQTEEYTNGGDPTWAEFVKASKTLYDNNVGDGNRSFVNSPDVWQTLALATDNNGRYQDAPSSIRDIPDFTSSGISAGEAYVGDFSNVVYGFRLNITLEQMKIAQSYSTVWVAAARLDIATFRPNALVRIEEAAA